MGGRVARLSTWVSRHEVAAFYLLLLALSWPYLFLTRGGGDAPGRMLPLVMVGPSMCAFAVVYLSRGRAGVRALARRLLLWRAPVRIYALVLLGLPALFMGVAYAVAVVLFPGEAGAPSANVMVTMAVNSVIIFVFAGLGEEFGWRGLALPQLQDRWGPLAASAVVGMMWFTWHLPLGFGEPGWFAENAAFLVSVTAATFFYTWLFNRTGGSVLLVALLHTMENSLGWPYQEVFTFEPPGFLFFDAVKAAVWVLVAVAVGFATRGLFGLRAREDAERR